MGCVFIDVVAFVGLDIGLFDRFVFDIVIRFAWVFFIVGCFSFSMGRFFI